MLQTLRYAAIGATMAAFAFLSTGSVFAADADAVNETTWASVEPDIFGDRTIDTQPGVITLEAPTRAEDAALVPVAIHIALPPDDSRTVGKVTLVVDENPSPLVATFKFGDGQKSFDLSTRVRVNSYSFVRAVAETSDGTLHMTKAFVKAAGGCSAPAVKDPVEARANLGQMRFRVFSGTGRDEAQVQIRHPNNSGMQMDQVTRLYTPAWFVQNLSIKQGDKVLFSMEGGISVSEDPTFRFSYHTDGQPVSVEAKDTDGNVFKKSFAADGNS
jgi:sulfur-oxidizing protein SoxY